MNRTGPLAFYLPLLAGGGAERVVLALADAFARKKEAGVDLVLGRLEGELAGLVPSGVNCHVLDKLGSLASVPKLARYIRDRRPSVLVSSMGHNNVAAVLAGRLAGGPTRIVICQHNSLVAECGPGRPLRFRLLPLAYRALLPFADASVAVSSGVAREIEWMCARPPGSVHTVYNPAWSPGHASAALDPAPHPWLEAGSDPVVVGIGRLVAQKDFATLIDAFARVRQHIPARLLIFGEGPERPALESRIAGLNLRQACRLPGFLQNPFAAMSRASLIVLSSRYEGFGNVLVESMGCGTPVVSTDCPRGPSEILENGRYGRLTPVGDPEALAHAIRETLSHRPDRDALQRRAAAFTVERAVEQYAAIFNAITGARSAFT